MIVLYDHQCFWEKYGGVSNYFVNVIKNLPKEVAYTLSVQFTNNEYIKELKEINTKSFLENVNFRGKTRVISLLNSFTTSSNISKNNYDIYHPTHYNYKWQKKTNKPVVITIHDMNFFKFPNLYLNSNFANKVSLWQREAVKYCDKIITISNNTKKDLIEFFKIPEKKISTIYHGCPSILSLNIEERTIKHNKDTYILFVGMRKFQKNFDLFLNAYKLFVQKNQHIKLICTGLPFDFSEEKLINKLKLENNITQVSASSSELIDLYKNALFFIYPSLYEGFGMPLLESMSYGCPVVCSNNSCFPEIAGNAAEYFNPNNVESILFSMERMLDSSYRNRLIKEGFLRVNYFSWKKCANEHASLYKGLM